MFTKHTLFRTANKQTIPSGSAKGIIQAETAERLVKKMRLRAARAERDASEVGLKSRRHKIAAKAPLAG